MTGLEKELHEFDKKHQNPLPRIIQKWRERWVKLIQQEKEKQSRPI
jgi:hypothetical protein